MKSKIVTAEQAIGLIHDGDTLVCSGFGVVGVPDELLLALQQRFESSQSPRALTLIFGGGPGDGKEQGINRIAIDGLIQRAIGGHWGLVPKLGAMAMENRIEAWNLPLGVLLAHERGDAINLRRVVGRGGAQVFQRVAQRFATGALLLVLGKAGFAQRLELRLLGVAQAQCFEMLRQAIGFEVLAVFAARRGFRRLGDGSTATEGCGEEHGGKGGAGAIEVHE